MTLEMEEKKDFKENVPNIKSGISRISGIKKQVFFFSAVKWMACGI